MERSEIVCYILAEDLDIKVCSPHFWVYSMTRIPKIGERIKGEELEVPETSWKCRLVIKSPKIMDMLKAFEAIDSVTDMGGGFVEHFRDLLVALVAGKRVL